MAEEHENEDYGGDLPEDGDAELDGENEQHEEDVQKGEGDGTDETKELEQMKQRLKEMEEEAAALRDMQAKVEKEMAAQGPAAGAAGQASKEEADARSVYVGNVDYACTPEELQQHFQSCGTVNRVTILSDKFGQPKGFAYVEFLEPEAVANAVLLTESELHGRQIKVVEKRTNVPGMKAYRPRGRGGYGPVAGYRPRRPYSPYGRFPRFRRPTRYRPYY